MTIINKVTPDENYGLQVELSNGNKFIVDFESKLDTVRFGKLRDKQIFRKIEIDKNMISWNSEIEVSLDEIILMLKR